MATIYLSSLARNWNPVRQGYPPGRWGNIDISNDAASTGRGGPILFPLLNFCHSETVTLLEALRGRRLNLCGYVNDGRSSQTTRWVFGCAVYWICVSIFSLYLP